MTDLHSHILPGVDDGAQTVEDSLALIRRQLEQGVDEIALTPHFNAERTSVEEFTQRRAEAFAILQNAVQQQSLPVKLKLGAEVFFSSNLLELDLEPLLLQDTPYLLVEFSPMFYPSWAKDIFYNLGLQGITPLLAHVERYPYMLSDPTRLFDLVSAGAVTQVNASSIMRAGSRQAMIQKFLRWQLVHVLSTDTHSVDKRPPLIGPAMQKVEGWQGTDMVRYLMQNAADVFAGLEPQLRDASKPKKFFGRWF